MSEVEGWYWKHLLQIMKDNDTLPTTTMIDIISITLEV